MLRSLLSCVFALPALASALSPVVPKSNDALSKPQGSPATSVLDCFEVSPPILTPASSGSDANGCVVTKTLMQHDFAYSYGQPFVGSYTPPDCSFNRVTMNFTVTSIGRQFDRLGIMYLGDIEVWRTSTAEPTSYGIVWTYTKEMHHYNSLWETEQKIIFDLGNLVDSTYTGIYNTTLTATFFTVPDSPPTADTILPISKRLSASNGASVFTVPGDNASVAYTLPQNVERAVISLSACGQSTEEFWYTNTLSSEADTFAATSGSLYGGSPWREVQILIDGQLAGVSWPFPTIFTGGIVPGFWRPIVGIDAFDLREHEVDITPWLPYLLDRSPHSFEIRVASLADDGNGHATMVSTPGSYWLVTGKIFLFLGSPSLKTAGSRPIISTPAPQFSISSHLTQNSTGANVTLVYKTTAQRSIRISSIVNNKPASWSQSLSYTNFNNLSSFGVTQYTTQSTTGADSAANPTSDLYSSAYSYPLTVNSTYNVSPTGAVGINGTLSRGLTLSLLGPSVIPSGLQSYHNSSSKADPLATFALSPLFVPQQITLPSSLPAFSGSHLSATQSGSATYFSTGTSNGSYSFGTTAQTLSLSGVDSKPDGRSTTLYRRDVEAVNTTITHDSQVLLGKVFGLPTGVAHFQTVDEDGPARSVRAMLGRGPGEAGGEGK